MARKALSLIVAVLITATMVAQSVSNPDVRSLPQEVKDTVTALRLTGTLTEDENSDFRQLREVCGRLATLDMSAAQVESIPDNAFFGAAQFKHVTLPAKVKSVGRYAFYRCTSLTGTLILPEGLQTLGEGAFQGCSKVKQLVLPSTLERISPWAFSRMLELRDTLTIPEGVKVIDRGAFYLSFRIPAIDLPATLDTIGPEAFGHSVHLSYIRVRATTPPVLSPSAFRDDVFATARLVVPAGCEAAYKKAPVWSRFFDHSAPVACTADTTLALIPWPTRVERPQGEPLVWSRLPLLAGAGMYANEYERLNEVLEEYTDYQKPKGAQAYMPCMEIDPSLPAEGYVLDIDANGLRIKGGSTTGIFYGIMTLRQVLISGAPEGGRCRATSPLHIEDAPRLAVRQLMIDPARTFIKANEIEDFIREMAYLKYNMLQLHLCDDQAWRVEIKAYPELTAESSVRPALDDMHRESAGFYTQSELRHLVDVAAKWHVMLVPEVEMPGHQTAAFHALPYLTCDTTKRLPIRVRSGVANELLCAGRESTYTFLGTVIGELCKIFPAPYFHIGGDEAGHPALGYWTSCPDCKTQAARLGFELDGKNNWRLQEYMFDRIIDTLQNKYGKTPLFWYETDFHNIQSGCVTYAWRHGKTGLAIDAALRNKARILLCPGEYCYFDYPMEKGDLPDKNWGMHATPLQKVYSFDPTWGKGEEFERTSLFGVAGTLWGECMPVTERLRYMAFPRIFALIEAAWSQQEARDYQHFLRRLTPNVNDLSRRAVPWSNKY
ncbi:MAG: family 20 glycosylhydrolase [Bacteroidaceae bacterium]|nr:family 20 glycosylhydrolase [Bacteroidaceae bacterium]